MSKTVIGLFRDQEEAQSVVTDLQRHGFAASDIGLVTQHADQNADAEADDSKPASEALQTGAGAGAAIGGLAGLLLGLGALAIPGFGPLLAAGPIAAALTGASIGVAAGGLIGALSHMGVPEDEANFYAEGVRLGGVLVTVHATDANSDQAFSILNRHGAIDADQRTESEPANPASEVAAVEPSVPVPSPDQSPAPQRSRVYVREPSASMSLATAPTPAEPVMAVPSFADNLEVYRQDYEVKHAISGYRFEQYSVAYRFGFELAQLKRYRRGPWSMIETEVHRRWEADNPGTWHAFVEAVRFAWERSRAAAGSAVSSARPQ